MTRILGIGVDFVELEPDRNNRIRVEVDRIAATNISFFVEDADYEEFRKLMEEMRFLTILSYCRENDLPLPVRGKTRKPTFKREPFGRTPLQPGICSYCNAWSDKLTRDHITPVAEGGTDDPDNIVVACQPCNSKKHTKSLLQVAQDIGRAALEQDAAS